MKQSSKKPGFGIHLLYIGYAIKTFDCDIFATICDIFATLKNLTKKQSELANFVFLKLATHNREARKINKKKESRSPPFPKETCLVIIVISRHFPPF